MVKNNKDSISIDGVTYVKEGSVKEKSGKAVSVVTGTPFTVGASYMIRTVTMIYTGELVAVYDKELVLSRCAWIADTKRWADSCEKGVFNEVEPYPVGAEVVIGRGAVLDAFVVDWELPTKQQ